MRCLIVLFCVIVILNVGSAAPQYNYQQLNPAVDNFAPAIFPVSNHQPIQQTLQHNLSTPSAEVQAPALPSATAQYRQQQLPTIVSKHFHTFSAPEENDDDLLQEIQGPIRKHYRVVFIKAPTQSSRAAALQFAQAKNEEKTVIYVLTKKTDAADLQAVLQQTAIKPPNKPEVYFIKYKTNDEAAHAQKSIQAQYDFLGGTSHVTDEGIAPVSSVVGSLGKSTAQASYNQRIGYGASNGYLPPQNY